MMMLIFIDEFFGFSMKFDEDDEEEEMKEEDEVFYEFLSLVPLRILFFDFGLSNFVTLHMERHINVALPCHTSPRHHLFVT